MGASRALEIAGPRTEDCLPGYSQASLGDPPGQGGKTRGADALAKAYRGFQQNGRTGATRPRRVPVNSPPPPTWIPPSLDTLLRPTPHVFLAPRVTETGGRFRGAIPIDSP